MWVLACEHLPVEDTLCQFLEVYQLLSTAKSSPNIFELIGYIPVGWNAYIMWVVVINFAKAIPPRLPTSLIVTDRQGSSS